MTRENNYDLMRASAAVAVVWLHVSSYISSFDSSNTNLNWWISNVANAYSRWSVPVFVMLSGALLMPKSRNTPLFAFIFSRLPRLILVTVFWTLFYILIFRREDTLYRIVKSIALGTPFYHLWYLYMLIGLYIFIPYIQRLYDSLSWESKIFLLGATFAIGFVEGLFGGGGRFFFTIFLSFIGYLVTGYELSQTPPRISRLQLYLAIILSGALAAVLAGLLLPSLGNRAWDVMYWHHNPLIVVMSLGAFILLFMSKYNGSFLKLAPLTLGIYVIHPFWLLVLAKLGVSHTVLTPVVSIPLMTAVIVILSALSTILIQRTPYLRRCV